MSGIEFPDETLMAYADGELDPARARDVARAAAADPGLAARIESFRGTRRAARAARLDAAGGDALQARIAAMAEAATLPRAQRPRRMRLDLPMAASIALALVLGGAVGYALAPRDGAEGPAQVVAAGAVPGALARALATTASGAVAIDADGREVRPVASFRDARGALCREFETAAAGAPDGVVAVACREGEAWIVRFSMAVPSAGGGYAPASALEALDAYLEGIGAGAPLEPDAEQAALTAGGREGREEN